MALAARQFHALAQMRHVAVDAQHFVAVTQRWPWVSTRITMGRPDARAPSAGSRWPGPARSRCRWACAGGADHGDGTAINLAVPERKCPSR
jgi:hypothetical protein